MTQTEYVDKVMELMDPHGAITFPDEFERDVEACFLQRQSPTEAAANLLARYAEDMQLHGDMLAILNELVRPVDLPRLAIRRAIETALPEIGMSEEDQEIVRDWLRDAAEGRI